MKTSQQTLLNSLIKENESLKQQLEDYRWLFYTSGVATKILSLDATYLDYNLAYRRLLGYSDDEVLTVFNAESVSAKTQPDGMGSIEKANKMIGIAVETGKSEFEWMQKKQDGSEFLTHITLQLINFNGEQCIRALIRDVSQMRKLEGMVEEKTGELLVKNKELEYLSFFDPLTKLYNRRKFEELLNISWEHAARSRGLIAIIFLDIDYFKLFNDSYGHLEGDNCLLNISQCIRQVAKRATDIVARYGGEELILVVSATDINNLQKLASSMIESVNQLKIPHRCSPVSSYVSVSIGCSITLAGVGCQKTSELIFSADSMMYKAKENGKNKYEIIQLGELSVTSQ